MILARLLPVNRSFGQAIDGRAGTGVLCGYILGLQDREHRSVGQRRGVDRVTERPPALERQPMPDRKIYHVSPRRLPLAPAIFGLYAAVLLAMGWLGGGRTAFAGALAVAAFVLAMGCGITALVWHSRLVVSAWGVEVRHAGWSARSDWENIRAIDLARGHEGLLLWEPLRRRGPWGLRAGAFMPGWFLPRQSAFVDAGHWIPLEPFAWWWYHGDLQQQFREHAPWLFAQEYVDREYQ